MKRDTKKLYAMKYMSKEKILAEKALKNVYNERKILESLNFPLIVNLWFAFQVWILAGILANRHRRAFLVIEMSLCHRDRSAS
jgi:serine/threonine protein kinase